MGTGVVVPRVARACSGTMLTFEAATATARLILPGRFSPLPATGRTSFRWRRSSAERWRRSFPSAAMIRPSPPRRARMPWSRGPRGRRSERPIPPGALQLRGVVPASGRHGRDDGVGAGGGDARGALRPPENAARHRAAGAQPGESLERPRRSAFVGGLGHRRAVGVGPARCCAASRAQASRAPTMTGSEVGASTRSASTVTANVVAPSSGRSSVTRARPSVSVRTPAATAVPSASMSQSS